VKGKFLVSGPSLGQKKESAVTDEIGFEIDFLPVGNGDRSGDAIALRYGTACDYKVIVYDGGTKDAGQKLVDHIRKYYGTERVDYVISSHPDSDHAAGLSVVLKQLEVGELWMHRPWNYSSVILHYFKDGRITDTSLAARLKDEMTAAHALEQLANKLGIPIYEPFSGSIIGGFVVLSPEKNWYVHDLIAEFQKSPEQKEADTSWIMLKKLSEAAGKAISWVAEKWGIETLRDDVETSAENESSVILFGNIEGQGILLTGDAGLQALNDSADYAQACGVSLPQILRFIQIPHHGSRHNVSTSVLDRIVGPRKPIDDGGTSKTAFVSAGKDSTTHPRKAVVNAFIPRGCKVIATQGSTKCHFRNMPPRKDWSDAVSLTFSSQVEAWD